VIFPFEVAFYKNYGVEAHYFGHPLLDEIHPKDYATYQVTTGCSTHHCLIAR
jgi:lipid A disaccharide synthetase